MCGHSFRFVLINHLDEISPKLSGAVATTGDQHGRPDVIRRSPD